MIRPHRREPQLERWESEGGERREREKKKKPFRNLLRGEGRRGEEMRRVGKGRRGEERGEKRIEKERLEERRGEERK